MDYYKESGFLLKDEFGTFFIDNNSIDKDWVEEKKYKPVIDKFNFVLKNDNSVIMAVRAGGADAKDMINEIYRILF